MVKNILVAVSGLTPQIISETFYCLAVKNKIIIDEIIVITTSRGRDVILGRDKEYNKKRKYPPLEKELARMCKMYELKIPSFKPKKNIICADEQSVELHDIRNDKDNILFPNKVCEVIKQKTGDKETVLHCTISGGRKTMSVDLAFALSLFGRMQDKLYHVLVDESLEFSKFFPETKSEAKKLEIAEIPYVRLRPLLGDVTQNKVFTKMSYSDIVKYTQQQLKIKSSEKLVINKTRSEILFGTNEPVHIEPKKLELYLHLYNLKLEGKDSENIITLTEKLFGVSQKAEELEAKKDNVLSYINKINKIIIKAVNDIEVEYIFFINGPGEFGKYHYGILADRDKFVIID
jgi:CRISPR-associated protein (TIGR02584 family)